VTMLFENRDYTIPGFRLGPQHERESWIEAAKPGPEAKMQFPVLVCSNASVWTAVRFSQSVALPLEVTSRCQLRNNVVFPLPPGATASASARRTRFSSAANCLNSSRIRGEPSAARASGMGPVISP
jgi:hypothetical protein